MRSVIYQTYGEPGDVLELAQVERPAAPQGRQVLVRVTHRAVHPGDLIGVRGGFRPAGSTAPPPAGGGRPGFEGAGFIEALGPDAEDGFGLTVGARVAFFPAGGAWSDYVLADADVVTPLPETVSNLLGSQLHVAPMTAALLIRSVSAAGVTPSADLVVLSAAGSAVARLVIEQLRQAGVGVIALVRRDAARQELQALFPGLNVIATEDLAWPERLKAVAGKRPIKAVLDPVAGELAAQLIDLMSAEGTYVSYGDLSREKIAVPALTFSARAITMTGVSVPQWGAMPRAVRQADLHRVMQIAEARPELFEIAATYPLDAAAVAARHAERIGKSGAVILVSE